MKPSAGLVSWTAGQLVTSVKTRKYCGKKTKISTTTNTWDANGNLILASTKTGSSKPDLMGYQYDEANQLTAYGEDLTEELEERSASLAKLEYKLAVKHATTFTYDALGRVVNQDLKLDHVVWAHDGLDPVYALDGKKPEIYLRDSQGELLGEQVGKKAEPEWYLTDALRSIVGTSKKGKLQLKDTDYTDYGIQLKDLGLRFGYSGERTDPEDNQVVHYYARTYDPMMGTWVEADEFRGVIAIPDSTSRHGFVLDNPTTYQDHEGRFVWFVVGGVAAVVAGVVAAPTPVAAPPTLDSPERKQFNAQWEEAQESKPNLVFTTFEIATTFVGVGVAVKVATKAASRAAAAYRAAKAAQQTMRARLLSQVKNQKLYNIVDNLYREGAVVGDGGTAAIVIAEGSHVQKAIDYARGLRKLISEVSLSASDSKIAQQLLTDLESALKYRGYTQL